MVRRTRGLQVPEDHSESPASLVAVYAWNGSAHGRTVQGPERDARFLSRLIEVAGGDRAVDVRLAGLLDLLASTTGAIDVAAAVATRDHSVLLTRAPGDDAGEQEPSGALAAWLNAARVPPVGRRRSASDDPGSARGGARWSRIELPGRATRGRSSPRREAGPPVRRLMVPRDRPAVALEFAFRSSQAAKALEDRLPRSSWRPAALLVASLSVELVRDRELEGLQRAEAERRRFVSVVAHELRTPLAALTGYLDLLTGAAEEPVAAPPAGQEADDARAVDRAPANGPAGGVAAGPVDRREFLDRARDLVEGMATLVADLLELTRLDSGQLHLSPAACSATEVAQAALHDVAPLAMARGITLEAALAPRLRTVYADRDRVRQILVNLLGNAIKFAPPASRVDLSLRFTGVAALFSVRDRGPGIAAEERALIFEPFHRAAGTERVVGTGLGLPIARDLARRMGGEMAVASVLGRGSAFLVALPISETAGTDAVQAALQEATGLAESEIGTGA